jgi:hypothetical protein
MVTTGVLCFANIPLAQMTNTDFGNPNFVSPSCVLGTPNCVFGNPDYFEIQDFTLSGPAGGGPGTYTLTIDTNYGPFAGDQEGDTTGAINPVGKSSMPNFCDNGAVFAPQPSTNPCPGGGSAWFMSDFIIQQPGTNTTYGVVMSTDHIDYGNDTYKDSYVAGDMYQVVNGANGGVQNNQQGNPASGPVIIDKGGTLEGTGSLSITKNTGCVGNENMGTSPTKDCALYKVTDTFTVGAGQTFFNPALPFTVTASSADCFNSSLVLNYVPEPGGLVWMVPVLLLVGAYLRRRKLAEVK